MGPEPEAMYAALCQTYAPRSPLREFAQGQISLNQLRVLVQHLPPDSALHRAIPELQGWRVADYLLAEVINTTRALFAVTVAANTEDGKYEPPELVDTPQTAAQREREDKERQEQLADAREWFSAIEAQLT